jgi:DNA-binding NarL/FixJ family response regulator
LNNRNILIIDDEPFISTDLKLICEELSEVSVYTANSYNEAISIINNHTIHLALIDINLESDKNGFDIANYINNNTLNCNIVFITAHKELENIKKATAYKPFGYIVKPYDEHQVKAQIFISLPETFSFLYNQLTPTEIKILYEVKNGFTSNEIANKLNVSIKTIENHRSNIVKKLNLPPQNNALINWILSNNF